MGEPAPSAPLPLLMRSSCFHGSARRGLLRLPVNGRFSLASSPRASRRPPPPLRIPTRKGTRWSGMGTSSRRGSCPVKLRSKDDKIVPGDLSVGWLMALFIIIGFPLISRVKFSGYTLTSPYRETG